MSSLKETLKSLIPFQKGKPVMQKETVKSILSVKALAELREDVKGRYAEVLFVTTDKAVLGLKDDLTVVVNLSDMGPVRAVGARFYFDEAGAVVDIVSTEKAAAKPAKPTRPSSTGASEPARSISKSCM